MSQQILVGTILVGRLGVGGGAGWSYHMGVSLRTDVRQRAPLAQFDRKGDRLMRNPDAHPIHSPMHTLMHALML